LCVKDVCTKFDLQVISWTTGNSSNKKSKESESAELKGAVSYDYNSQKENQYLEY